MDQAQEEQQTEEQQQPEQTGTNRVDVRPENINRRLDAIAKDAGIQLETAGPAAGAPAVAAAPAPVLAVTEGQAGKGLGELLRYGFQFGFGWFLPHWEVKDEESVDLGKVWGELLAKYIPLNWLQWVPTGNGGDGAACVECEVFRVTMGVVQPRLLAEVEAESHQVEAVEGEVTAKVVKVEESQPAKITEQLIEPEEGMSKDRAAMLAASVQPEEVEA